MAMQSLAVAGLLIRKSNMAYGETGHDRGWQAKVRFVAAPMTRWTEI